MSRRKLYFDDLPVETIAIVVQLLINWSPLSEDAFPYVPPSYPGKTFLSPIASLSRVSKKLRAICTPYLFSCLSCHGPRRLARSMAPFYNCIVGDSTTKHVKTLSIIMPHYTVNIKSNTDLERKRQHDFVISASVSCIPRIFDSLHCLRLHNVPYLDNFFNALQFAHSLRVLDLTVCDSVLGANCCRGNYYDDIPTFREVVRGAPPLESLRIKFSFEYENGNYFSRHKDRVIHHMIALIGATEASLFDLSVDADIDMSIDMLNSLDFTRLRRLALRSWSGKSSEFHKLILKHSAHLTEANLEYDVLTETHVTLSSISRIIQGVSPREGGHKDASIVAEDAVDSLVHPEDGNWGHFECKSFGYAKRLGEIVELSLSFPLADFHGTDIDANTDLDFTELADFLAKYPQLELLTLVVAGHDEGSFSEIMDVLGHLCHHSLRKLRTLNLFVELEGMEWGAGRYSSKDMDMPGDKFMGDDDFAFSDDEKDFCLTYVHRMTEEERGEKWKKFEAKYYKTVHTIMSSYLKMASSVKEVVWHFFSPQEGAVSSCWIWKRAKVKGRTGNIKSNNTSALKWVRGGRLKVEAAPEPSSIVVGDLMVHGAIRMPEPFTFAVGREATYLKTFEHRG